MKKICDVCKGNGFIRVPYEQAREEQFADCEFCNNQGEIEVEDENDDFYNDQNQDLMKVRLNFYKIHEEEQALRLKNSKILLLN